MKFSCDRDAFLSAVTTASRAAASKSPIDALQCLLFEAGVNVKVTGYDLKKGIYMSLDATVAEEGSAIIEAKILCDIARSMPDGIVTVTADGTGKASIICGNSEFDILTGNADDFPALPDMDYLGNISIKQGVLRRLINETIFAVSDNESRPVYMGSLFDISGDELTIVSVDGYRLAKRTAEIERSEKEEDSFIVPGTALSEVEKICGDSDEPVKITVGSKHVSFSIGEIVLLSRRLEGDFINYKKTVPTQFCASLTVDRREFLSVVDRVSLIIEEKTKNPLRCLFEDGEIVFRCVTGKGKAEDVCPAEGDGQGLEIGFNNRYLREAFRAAPADKVQICVNSATAPCVIKAEDDSEDFLYMILPVRI